jgi:hypothetical protein
LKWILIKVWEGVAIIIGIIVGLLGAIGIMMLGGIIKELGKEILGG